MTRRTFLTMFAAALGARASSGLAAASDGSPASNAPIAFASNVELVAPDASSRLATVAGVLWRFAQPNMRVEVGGIGTPTPGSILIYGVVPDVPSPSVPPKPQLPPNATPLQRQFYKA